MQKCVYIIFYFASSTIYSFDIYDVFRYSLVFPCINKCNASKLLLKNIVIVGLHMCLYYVSDYLMRSHARQFQLNNVLTV